MLARPYCQFPAQPSHPGTSIVTVIPGSVEIRESRVVGTLPGGPTVLDDDVRWKLQRPPGDKRQNSLSQLLPRSPEGIPVVLVPFVPGGNLVQCHRADMPIDVEVIAATAVKPAHVIVRWCQVRRADSKDVRILAHVAEQEPGRCQAA